MDNIDIACIFWMAFNYAILCPLMMFCLFLFYKIDKGHALMKYRNKIIVYLLNAMMFTTLLFERLYANCVAVWSFTNMQPNWIFYLVFGVLWWTPFFLFAVKVFDLYYTQQYAIAMQDMIWQTSLNSSIENENWFIKSKHTYGNIIFCTKISLIPCIICCIINMVVAHICGEGLILDCTQFIVASIPVIFSFIMCFKSRKIKDVYYIRNEIVTQCSCIMVALILYLSTFLYYKVNSYPVEEAIRMEWLIRNLVAQLCAIGLALISTLYPVYLVQRHQLQNQVPPNSNANLNTTAIIKHLISKYESYKAFMQYLISEFSTESLLFITELVMIKSQALRENNDKTGLCVAVRKTLSDSEHVHIYLCSNSNGTHGYYCDFYDNNGRVMIGLNIPSDIPISDIVTNNEKDLAKQMRNLYNKYVTHGSYQINISGTVRNTLKHIFEQNDQYNKNNKYELFNIMDQAAMEILSLLTDPLERFVNSALFQNIFVEDMATEPIANTIENNNGTNFTDTVKSVVTPQSPLLLNDTVSEMYKCIAKNTINQTTNQNQKQ